jgi:hypothetical protein
MIQFPGPAGGRACTAGLPFDQSNVSGARTLGRLFCGELHPLPFAEQLEDGAPDGAAVEEMFDATLITNEPESLVNEETCNSPGRHSRVPPMRESLGLSQALRGPLYERTYEANGGTAAPMRSA